MKEFSVPMALVDFVPVIFFAIASVMLQRELYNKMSKGAFALFDTTQTLPFTYPFLGSILSNEYEFGHAFSFKK